MATRTHTATKLGERGDLLVVWTGLLNTDDGSPFDLTDCQDVSVQLVGTLGAGGTCLIEGALYTATPTYGTMQDLAGTALSLTALGFKRVGARTVLIRPRVSAGDGTTDLSLRMLVSKLPRR